MVSRIHSSRRQIARLFERRQPRQAGRPRRCGALACGGAGGLLAGAGIACLTLELNPQLSAAGERALLVGELAVLYGILGAVAGAVTALAIAATRRLPVAGGDRAEVWLPPLLVAGPVCYLLLMPDLGFAGDLLTRLWYRADGPLRAAAILALLATAAVLGRLAEAAVGRLAPRLGLTPRRLACSALALAVAAIAGIGVFRPGTDPRASIAAALAGGTPDDGIPDGGTPDGGTRENPPPVVLLMIDGADLDDVVLPMVEAGELPAFARLIRQGASGPLATIQPTLSPRIWTTVATGKAPEEHGIHDFLNFRLPGIGPPIDRFARHSGLNERLFPWLESLPGLGFLRSPYTSNLRRVRALWEIAGERYPVGVYRWLVTWPAEEVRGFLVAAGNLAGVQMWHRKNRKWFHRLRDRLPGAEESLETYPADLRRVPGRRRRPSDRTLAAYLAPGQPLERSQPGVRVIAASLRDPTIRELPALMREYRPVFTAAAFYSVDRFQHHFSRDYRRGGPFAPAVAERYRLADRMLGRFVDTLPPDAHLLVISDHGFDFEKHQHWEAPPGLFLARGPAFPRGRRITGLSVYDIAPLCLHLLGLPLPADMPGAMSGAFRRVLAGAYLEEHPATRIATYERGPRPRRPLDEIVRGEELKAELKSLGYL